MDSRLVRLCCLLISVTAAAAQNTCNSRVESLCLDAENSVTLDCSQVSGATIVVHKVFVLKTNTPSCEWPTNFCPVEDAALTSSIKTICDRQSTCRVRIDDPATACQWFGWRMVHLDYECLSGLRLDSQTICTSFTRNNIQDILLESLTVPAKCLCVVQATGPISLSVREGEPACLQTLSTEQGNSKFNFNGKLLYTPCEVGKKAYQLKYDNGNSPCLFKTRLKGLNPFTITCQGMTTENPFGASPGTTPLFSSNRPTIPSTTFPSTNFPSSSSPSSSTKITPQNQGSSSMPSSSSTSTTTTTTTPTPAGATSTAAAKTVLTTNMFQSSNLPTASSSSGSSSISSNSSNNNILKGISTPADYVDTADKSELNVGPIIGGVAGGAAFLILLLILIILLCRRRQKSPKSGSGGPPDVVSADTALPPYYLSSRSPPSSKTSTLPRNEGTTQKVTPVSSHMGRQFSEYDYNDDFNDPMYASLRGPAGQLRAAHSEIAEEVPPPVPPSNHSVRRLDEMYSKPNKNKGDSRTLLSNNSGVSDQPGGRSKPPSSRIDSSLI